MEDVKTYLVHWETKKTIGFEYYSNERMVEAESPEEAIRFVRHIIGAQFPERGGYSAIKARTVKNSEY